MSLIKNRIIYLLALFVGLQIMSFHLWAGTQSTQQPAQLFAQIPFFEGGDLGQYQITYQQDRDTVRKMLWSDLMDEVQKLAASGASVEKMMGPMAQVMLAFDRVHDQHKAMDSIRIDQSIEQQFKAELDNLYREYDIRDKDRKLVISAGDKMVQLKALLQMLEAQKKVNKTLSDVALLYNIVKDIDYVAYGHFSSLGKGQFQVTFHLVGHISGQYRSFVSRGRLTAAVSDLAMQVFNYFQKNSYPEWQNPQQGLVWMPMPINPEKNQEGYTFAEANSYCKMRGFRLPYAREILTAETGTQYKDGGISSLKTMRAYAVADLRLTSTQHWLTPGTESNTGGAIQPASADKKGSFWCVKGAVQSDIQRMEKVFSLIRKYRMNDSEIYRALETIRYFQADFGAQESFFAGTTYLKVMDSEEEALNYLKARGISL